MFAERAAKRERRPKRARAMPEEEEQPSKGQRSHHGGAHPEVAGHLTNGCPVSAAANQKAAKGGKKSTFDKELTNTSRKSLKNYRAG